MKKNLLFLALFFAFSLKMQAQTTYYWKGATGAAATPTDWQTSANWNTLADGTGTGRVTPAVDDILIFDGSATTTTTSYVGNVPTETLGTLKITGSAQVHVISVVASALISDAITSVLDYGGFTYHPVKELTGANFTANLKVGDFIYSTTNNLLSGQVLAIKDASTITVSSDKGLTTAASYTRYISLYPNNLLIDALSSLNLGSGSAIPFALITKGGRISGSVNFGANSGLSRLFCTTPNRGNSTDGLRFLTGSSFTFSGASVTNYKKQYPLGHTLGLYSGNTFIYNDGNGSNNTTPGYNGEAGIVFETGSLCYYKSGDPYTPFGISAMANNSNLFYTPSVAFKAGSKFKQEAWVGSAIYRINKSGSTLYFIVGSFVSYPDLELASAFPNSGDAVEFGSVGNLTLSGTVVLPRNGAMVVKGDITNTTAASITLNNIFLAGSTNQTISGALSFGNLVIGDKAVATLSSNITAANVHLIGKLNFGSNTITGTGVFATYGTYSKTAVSGFTLGSASVGGLNNAGVGTLIYDYPIGSSISNSTYIVPNSIFTAYASGGLGSMSSFSKGTVASGETVTFSTAGSAYTTSQSTLALSAPGFATYLLDVNGPTVLPLDLLSFAGVLSSNKVKLNWSTANEINVKEFIIEKRVGDEFIKIATVAAQNNSNGASYSLVDNFSSLNANNYYRLKMIDADGVFKYSNVVVVNLPNLNASVLSLSAYPNPTTNSITISHAIADLGAKLTALTIDGKTVFTKMVEKDAAQSTMDVSTLPTGVYLLVYRNNNQSNSLRFVKN